MFPGVRPRVLPGAALSLYFGLSVAFFKTPKDQPGKDQGDTWRLTREQHSKKYLEINQGSTREGPTTYQVIPWEYFYRSVFVPGINFVDTQRSSLEINQGSDQVNDQGAARQPTKKYF